jgi:hypothetical protein
MNTSITKTQCKEFLSNPSINPLTGRKIEIGKVTHQKLLKLCNKSDTIEKPKSTAPPMGPIMHYRMNSQTKSEDQNNLIDMGAFIEERLKKLEKQSSISSLEIWDFEDILKEAKLMFRGEDEYIEYFDGLMKQVHKLVKTKTQISDGPSKSVVVEGYTVYPHRYKVRDEVLSVWSGCKTALETIENSLRKQQIYVNVRSGTIRDIIKGKKFLDYLIAHNIFTYDDIYKRTFISEKVFDELQEKYKKYRELYKKVKGKSPI